MKLTLPILHHTETSHLLNDLGIGEQSEFEPKDMIFYIINAIKPYDEDKSQTTIYANNDTFICDMPCNKVEALINNARLK